MLVKLPLLVFAGAAALGGLLLTTDARLARQCELAELMAAAR